MAKFLGYQRRLGKIDHVIKRFEFCRARCHSLAVTTGRWNPNRLNRRCVSYTSDFHSAAEYVWWDCTVERLQRVGKRRCDCPCVIHGGLFLLQSLALK